MIEKLHKLCCMSFLDQTHSDTPHSVGFLWTSDQTDAETST